jgi:hypothetical protein
MKRILLFIVCMGAAAGLILGLTSCDQDEVVWETTTSAVGANLTDQETFDAHFRDYRVRVNSALEVMKRSLDSARRQTSVADRAEIDDLTSRIDRLRQDMLAEFDVPRANTTAMRRDLEESFDGLRDDVEALLLRLGHSRDEFSAWQEAD